MAHDQIILRKILESRIENLIFKENKIERNILSRKFYLKRAMLRIDERRQRPIVQSLQPNYSFGWFFISNLLSKQNSSFISLERLLSDKVTHHSYVSDQTMLVYVTEEEYFRIKK